MRRIRAFWQEAWSAAPGLLPWQRPGFSGFFDSKHRGNLHQLYASFAGAVTGTKPAKPASRKKSFYFLSFHHRHQTAAAMTAARKESPPFPSLKHPMPFLSSGAQDALFRTRFLRPAVIHGEGSSYSRTKQLGKGASWRCLRRKRW